MENERDPPPIADSTSDSEVICPVCCQLFRGLNHLDSHMELNHPGIQEKARDPLKRESINKIECS